MKIKDIFYPFIQGHQITDEELYKTQGDIPVLTGRNEIKGYWNQSIIKKEHLPCLTYPTKANAGNVYIQYEIFDANNTAVLVPKPEWKSKLNLEWFAFKLYHIFLDKQTSKEGVSYLNKEIIEDVEIEIPKKQFQEKELKSYKKLEIIKNQIELVKDEVKKVLQKSLVLEFTNTKEVLLSTIFEYTSRNDVLSEEGIYNMSSNLNDSGNNITVISGKTDGIYGYVPMYSDLHILSDKPCLQVVTRGVNAGTIKFLSTGIYATNTNAMLLSIKGSIKNGLNFKKTQDEVVFLKFFETYLQPIFYDYRSSGDHSVFPLTKAINDISIPHIKYNKNVLGIVKKYEKINEYQKELTFILNKIEKLLSKQGRSSKDKAPVLGMIERKGKLVAKKHDKEPKNR